MTTNAQTEPPPLPPGWQNTKVVFYKPLPDRSAIETRKRRAGFLAKISMGIAVAGIVPLLVFLLVSLFSVGNRAGVSPLGFVMFIIGFFLHGAAFMLGVLSVYYDDNNVARFAIIGNFIILFLSAAGLFLPVID